MTAIAASLLGTIGIMRAAAVGVPTALATAAISGPVSPISRPMHCRAESVERRCHRS